jgi:methionyl-tRNA formyltransferase
MSAESSPGFVGAYGFFGTGSFAARCLELLLGWRTPAWVVTSPPSRAGRGRGLSPSPVESFARDALPDVALLNSGAASSDEAVLGIMGRIPVSFSFVIDFGQMIKAPLLASGLVGCLNVHPSLLPAYRGAAPIQRALMDRVEETGVSVFRLTEGMDSGPILLREKISVARGDDSGTIAERAAQAGTSAFIEFAKRLPMGEWTFERQDDSLVTYAPKIRPEEERIEWSGTANEICGVVRALCPKPGAWTMTGGKRLKLLRVDCAPDELSAGKMPGELLGRMDGGVGVASGGGCVILRQVQMEGKKIQEAAEWFNGLRAASGERLL